MSERREVDAAARTVADPLPITPPVAVPHGGPLTVRHADPHAERIAVLRTHEPWWRTAWAGAKAAVISALTFWGGMSLMEVEPINPLSLVLIGVFSAAITIGRRRSGFINPPSVYLVGGAAVALMGLTIAVTALVAGDTDPVLMGGFFAVMGTVGIAMGVRMRRQERAMSTNLNVGRAASVRFPRAELARRVELVRARNLRQLHTMRRAVGAVVLTGVVLFGLTWIPSVGALIDRIPESAWMLVFFGFWATVIGGILWARRKERQAAAEDGLLCPSCSQPLLGSTGNMRFAKLIEDEGLCPQCGVLIVEDVPA